MRVGSLCSGYEGIFLAIREIYDDAELAFVADNDPGAAKILEYHFPGTVNLGDITKADWGGDAHGKLQVDILTAGFP
jgi:DNA (cytosine-5)-methyltransferase 1